MIIIIINNNLSMNVLCLLRAEDIILTDVHQIQTQTVVSIYFIHEQIQRKRKCVFTANKQMIT